MRQIIPICCFCERVRDDAGTEPGEGVWQDVTLYTARYVLKPEEVMFSHTYCPSCLSYYRSFLGVSAGATNIDERKGKV